MTTSNENPTPAPRDRKSLKSMPSELVEQLFSEFKNDTIRWHEFSKREFATGLEELPGRAAIVHEFVAERLGRDHGYLLGELIIEIRKDVHGFKETKQVERPRRRWLPAFLTWPKREV